ncbi:MAG TPA: FAD-dependent thymidylate synthase [bacterium]|nr:FAD-dependent thymidylate synthase [bacterium]
MNEDTGLIQHTHIVNVYKNGIKPVFRMILCDGKTIECTADHRFRFADGWKTLAAATGLRLVGRHAVWTPGNYDLYVNGRELSDGVIHRDRSWLNEQYNVLNRRISDIAAAAGISYPTIRKWIRKYGLAHAKGGRSTPPWNVGRRYRLGPRRLSSAFTAANRRVRSGPASNFWRGGVTSGRASVARWTAQAARRVHDRNGWTCQLCHERSATLHAHHIVPVWADASRARDERNLTTLCIRCHRRVHLDELAYVEQLGGPPARAEWVRRPRIAWNRVVAAKMVRIERFEYAGEKDTYDIEVEGPYHNFVANGIVTHNSVNEYSTRYSVAIDATQQTAPDEWRLQAAGNRQGSSGTLPVEAGERLSAAERALQDEARRVYEERLAAGVAREQARKDLPLSTYTEAYWKINLHNLLHFLHLRMDDHAQEEIRAYARVIGEEIVAAWVPIAWEAFLDYRRHALQLSGIETEIVRLINLDDRAGALRVAGEHGLLTRRRDGGLARNRERAELDTKLALLGLVAPWS